MTTKKPDEAILAPWMGILVHEPEEPFQPEGNDRTFCKFCMGDVTHPIHGKDQFPGDDEIIALRQRYFRAKLVAYSRQDELRRSGVDLQQNDVSLRRLEYLIEILMAGWLENKDRLTLEAGWAENLAGIYEESMGLLGNIRTAVAGAGLYVPRNNSGLVVPGSSDFGKDV